MRNAFFTSDTHYGHEAILKHCSRPFATVQEMDEALVENHNRVVREGDTVWHLGDFGLGKGDHARRILGQLRGHKHLIVGNHDDKGVLKAGWESVQEYKEIYAGDNRHIALFHYPILSWRGAWRRTYHLHGHSHGAVPIDPHFKRWDAGVDPQGYFPVSLEEVLEYFSMLEDNGAGPAVDHHDPRYKGGME